MIQPHFTHFTQIERHTLQQIHQKLVHKEAFNKSGTMEWIPIDHTSRALTKTEQNYSPIEREGLAQSWTMKQFRYYLLGKPFTAWTDHEPLVQIYNNKQKTVSKRVGKHRDAVQDLDFRMIYMKGKEMPCDYGSRHPRENSLEPV